MSSRTPRDIVQRLHREITAAVNSPDVRAQFLKLGADPLTMSQPEFEALIHDEFEENARLVKSANIKSQ